MCLETPETVNSSDFRLKNGARRINDFFFKKVTHSFTYFPHLRKIQFEEKVTI